MARGNQSIDIPNPKEQYLLIIKNPDRIWGIYDTLPSLRTAIGHTPNISTHKFLVKKIIVSTNEIELTEEEQIYIQQCAIDKNRDVEF